MSARRRGGERAVARSRHESRRRSGLRGPGTGAGIRDAGARSERTSEAQPAAPTDAELVLGGEDASLLDIVDNVLSKGVVLTGDVTIGLAQVDLIYARLSLLLCAADRVLPKEDADVLVRHSRRHAVRSSSGRRG